MKVLITCTECSDYDLPCAHTVAVRAVDEMVKIIQPGCKPIVGAYQLPVRKRAIRACARFGSLCASGLLALNILTLHAVLNLAWTATVMLIIVAVCNLVAAFAEDLSIRSFVASMIDLMLALGAAVCFIMQAGAAETSSSALRTGMQLLAGVLEVWVIGFNLGASLAGAISDDVLEEHNQ